MFENFLNCEQWYSPNRVLNPNRIFLLSRIWHWAESYIRKHQNFIDNQGRVRIFQVECAITHGCNLRCAYCSFMCGYRKGIVSKDDILLWLENWKRKISPRIFLILGGEPLLHPDLSEILEFSRQCWPKTRLKLVTNGLLMPKIKDPVLEALKRTRTSVEMSLHFNTPEYQQKFQAGISRLKAWSIPYKIRPSATHWIKLYDTDKGGRIIPSHSNPDLAWENCCCRMCQAIDDNMLFKCSHLANWRQAYREGVLGKEWDAVSSYQPLTVDATAEEIVSHLFPHAVKECSLCVETKKYITPGQL